MREYEIKLNFLLDLFEAGYKNAYVSAIHCFSRRNNFYQRIDVVLPNVGRLWLYQSFDESNDEQIPLFDVFYMDATQPNIRTKIQNRALLERAVRIIYKAYAFFKSHPEYISNGQELIKRIQQNESIARKQYASDIKKYHNFLKTFER